MRKEGDEKGWKWGALCWTHFPSPFLLHSLGLFRALRSSPYFEIWDPKKTVSALERSYVNLWMHITVCVCVCVQVKLQPPLHSPNKLCVFVCSVAQSCLTLFNPMDCSPPGSSFHGISQARILKWVAIFLLQGIFPTQGSNPCLLCLLHWQADSLSLSHLGSPNSVSSSSPGT